MFVRTKRLNITSITTNNKRLPRNGWPKISSNKASDKAIQKPGFLNIAVGRPFDSSSDLFIKSTANTGFIINATINDAVNVKMSMVGKYIMNLPMMPGQNSNGKNGHNVVSVPARTGTNISPAAIIADVGA